MRCTRWRDQVLVSEKYATFVKFLEVSLRDSTRISFEYPDGLTVQE